MTAAKLAAKLRPLFPFLLCAACGGTLRLAFPDFEQTELAWFAVAPLLIMLRFATPKKGFWLGFTFGIAFWMSSLLWLLELRNNGGPILLVLIGLVGLSIWCSLFTGIFGMLASFLWQGGDWRAPDTPQPVREKTDAPAEAAVPLCFPDSATRAGIQENLAAHYWFETWRPFAIALLWVGTEYIRSNLFTGFAWNSVGVSQYANIAAIQVASLGGVYAVSFLVILMNAAGAGVCVRMWRNIRGLHPEDAPRPTRRHFDLMLILTVILVAFVWSTKRVRTISRAERDAPTVRIAAMNPEMPCIFERAEDEERLDAAYASMWQSVRTAARLGTDLIVLPETVLIVSMPHDIMETEMLAFACDIGAPILAGGTEIAFVGTDRTNVTNWMNASFLFGTSNRVEGVYRKQHLVPFGEYIPFDKTIPWLQRFAPTGVSITPGNAPTVMSIADGRARVSPLICFEDTVADLSRHAVQAGAQILVSQSNDAWFTGSSEARQHHAQAIFRAVENGVPMVRSSNQGIVAAVGATGRIIPPGDPARVYFMRQIPRPDETEPAFYAGFGAHIPVVQNPRRTLYTRIGDWALGIPSALLVVAGITAVMIAGYKRRMLARHER